MVARLSTSKVVASLAVLISGALASRFASDLEDAADEQGTSQQEAVAVAGDAARAGEATLGPAFDPAVLGQLLEPLPSEAPRACGAKFESAVQVQPAGQQAMAEGVAKWFQAKQVGSRVRLVAAAAGWVGAVRSPDFALGPFPVMDGQVLLRVAGRSALELAGLPSLAAALREASTGGPLELVFEAGMDLRHCWGNLHDLEDREVCSAELLASVARDVAKERPRYDDVGQSGSTIVTNLPNFIIKNVKDSHEYELMAKAMPGIGAGVAGRQQRDGGCYSTALAPMCAVVIGPGGVGWLVLRKIGIEDGVPLKLPYDEDEVSWQDLKGPKFARPLRDGKTFFGSAAVWHHKDKGFVGLFPKGLPLGGCGSRDAAFALDRDAQLLMEHSMTDYSLFGTFYHLDEGSSGPSRTCACERAAAPRWPLVLEASPEGRPKLRFAIGIIDYVEQRVNSDLIGQHLSTMKKPEVYREWWMRMWPQYFHLPPRTLQEDGTIPAEDHQPAERFSVGQRVYAIMKIKWKGGSASHRKEFWIKYPDVPELNERVSMHKENLVKASNDRHVFGYFEQIKETSAEKPAGGSKYKVYSGSMGTILQVSQHFGGRPEQPPSLVVAWDSQELKPWQKVFRVAPEQVVGLPREVLG